MSFTLRKEEVNSLLKSAAQYLYKNPKGPRLTQYAIGCEIGYKDDAMVKQMSSNVRPDVMPACDKGLSLLLLAEAHGWQGWEVLKAERLGLVDNVNLNGRTDDEDLAVVDSLGMARSTCDPMKRITGYKRADAAIKNAIKEVLAGMRRLPDPTWGGGGSQRCG